MASALVICMGVSGSGKSTLAAAIARQYALHFIEADTLHSTENVNKMRSGKALTDSDRAPWMNRVCAEVRHADPTATVLAHSCLRRAHRDQLRNCGRPTLFLHLALARETIAKRMLERENHFMPAELLASQFDALEPPANEADVIALDASRPVDAMLKSIDQTLRAFLEHSAVRSRRR